MSAGQFVISKYELNDGKGVQPIKIQPETLSFTYNATNNAPTADPITSGRYVYARGAAQQYGVKARRVTFKWVSAVPEGYDPNQRITIPILTEALWNDIEPGTATSTYLAATVQIISKTDERVR